MGNCCFYILLCNRENSRSNGIVSQSAIPKTNGPYIPTEKYLSHEAIALTHPFAPVGAKTATLTYRTY